jgi:hypothetical protein
LFRNRDITLTYLLISLSGVFGSYSVDADAPTIDSA